jgi:hypothetical protein
MAGLWVAFGFCALFAVIFLLIGKAEKKRYRVSNQAVCDDMDDLAQRAGHDGLGVIPPAPRIGVRQRFAQWRSGEKAPLQ